MTCSNGVRTRSRTWDNPPPGNGGLPCYGNDTEQLQSSLDVCPSNILFKIGFIYHERDYIK